MSLKPLKDSILFEFAQASRDGFFRNETTWGFKISGADIDASKPRWGIAKVLGPDCKYVKVGDYIMIDALKWTNAHEYGGEKVWRTAEEHIIGTSEGKPEEVI